VEESIKRTKNDEEPSSTLPNRLQLLVALLEPFQVEQNDLASLAHMHGVEIPMERVDCVSQCEC
jgi:hypothetical protein